MPAERSHPNGYDTWTSLGAIGTAAPRLRKASRPIRLGLLQMVVAMKVGMLIYHLNLERVLGGTDFAALHTEYPVFGHWMMVAAMAVAMIIFMRSVNPDYPPQID